MTRAGEGPAGAEAFSLLGGPVQRLGARLGLVRGRSNTVLLGLAIGLSLWIVMLVLSTLGSDLGRLFSLAVIGTHARLLIVLPLFFVGESVLDPRLAEFVGPTAEAGLVPPSALPALERELSRLVRWKDSWIPDALCLLATALWLLLLPGGQLIGTAAALGPASWWYSHVCLSVFHFLTLRWIWRLGLWWHFLWRFSKLPLRLVPTHPDGVAGLGYLEVVHSHFAPLVVAIAVAQSSSLAEEIYSGAPFEVLYPALAVTFLMVAGFFLTPLFFFFSKLWACRVKGLSDYMVFASRYVNAFDDKWLGRDDAPAAELLGTSDIQSLADLNNSVSIVRGMRLIPLSPRLLVQFAVATVLPMLPLSLLKYPAAQLIEKFFSRLAGL